MVSDRDKQSTDTAEFALRDSSSENQTGACDRRRSKRAKVQVNNDFKSTMTENAVKEFAAATFIHPSPKPTDAKRHAKHQSTLQLDAKILSNLTDQSSLSFYHEESAYRYHNPPFPEPGPSQLAIIRNENIPGKLHPVQHDHLKPLPPPSHIPELPSTGFCSWTYNDRTRVLFADFRVSPLANRHDGKVHVTREDEQFLLKMMERDDITVISQGLIDEINPSLLSREYVEGVIGSRFHHKVKEFERTILRHRGSSPTGEVMGQYEEKGWYSMKVSDYFNYLDRRQQFQGDDNINSQSLDGDDRNTDILFEFTDSEDRNMSIDPREVVLYMLDLDMVKMLPRAYDDFIRCFKVPSILPGGSNCLMNAVNINGRPFMGPNIYITPPSSFTHFHQDGNGTVDSGHYCHRGYNEVIMLRRLPERHKHHAIHLLTGRLTFTSEFLYGKPHDQDTRSRWPTNAAIEACVRMGYCPSVFILKPGQLVHINKGRLHAFRKLSHLPLHETDCHYYLRNQILPLISREDFVCVSVAWDWMFKGITSEGINREVASILECARLNQTRHVQSLAIPETALLFIAEENLARLRIKSSIGTRADPMEFTPDPMTVLRGILPSLQFVVHRHLMAEKISTTWVEGGKHKKVSVDPKPNAWQNLDTFSMDPYGSGDFICKFCLEELSNVFMHCDGCERLLNKDFNICTSCHSNEMYKANIKMHPFNPKMKSTLNHTGMVNFQRQSRCPCKNGPQCDACLFCVGCSCTCHQQFTLHYRFMLPQEEHELLCKAETAVGADIVPAALETKARLFSLLSGDFQVPIDAFSNDGMCGDPKLGAASSPFDLASTIVPSTAHKTARETEWLDDDGGHSGVEAGRQIDTSGVEELISNQESAEISGHPTFQYYQAGLFATKQSDFIKQEDANATLVKPTTSMCTTTNKTPLNFYNIYPAAQNSPFDDSAAKHEAGNISISESRCPDTTTKLSEKTRNEVGHVSTRSEPEKPVDSYHNEASTTPKVEYHCSDEKERDFSVTSYVQDDHDSDSDPISQADLDALDAGSRVVIYHNSKYWNATIKKRGDKRTKGKFQVHYDGNKQSARAWVKEDKIARIMPDAL